MREVEKTYKKHKSDIESIIGEIDFMALAGHVCRFLEPSEYPEWDEKWKAANDPKNI